MRKMLKISAAIAQSPLSELTLRNIGVRVNVDVNFRGVGEITELFENLTHGERVTESHENIARARALKSEPSLACVQPPVLRREREGCEFSRFKTIRRHTAPCLALPGLRR